MLRRGVCLRFVWSLRHGACPLLAAKLHPFGRQSQGAVLGRRILLQGFRNLWFHAMTRQALPL